MLESKLETLNKEYNFLACSADTPQIGKKKLFVKANMSVKGWEMHACSRVLKGNFSNYTSTVIKKLQDHGYEVAGVTLMDEFAMGSLGYSDMFGWTLNPWNKNMVAGGSSGGSAVAVALGCSDVALGSSTGGSVRMPAALCGVIGFKPSFGCFSRHGLTLFSNSFDQIGIFSRDISHTIECFKLIVGPDEHDMTTWIDVPLIERRTSVLLLPQTFIDKLVDSTSAQVYASAVEQVKQIFPFRYIEDPEKFLDWLCACGSQYLLASSVQAFSNLQRYNFVRYPSGNRGTFEELRKHAFEVLGPRVKERLCLGYSVLVSGEQSNIERKSAALSKTLESLLGENELLFLPTNNFSSLLRDESLLKVLPTRELFLSFANLCGCCAISLPVDNNHPTVGMQFIGRRFNDRSVLKAAALLLDCVPRLNYSGLNS